LTNVDPIVSQLEGRLKTYAEEAFVEYRRGRPRGCYDLLMLAFNSTLAELKPQGIALFERLEALVQDGKLDGDVVKLARGLPFLVKHDRGITDMDLSYMSEEELLDFIRFLELYFTSLKQRCGGLPGVEPAVSG
jgi:hypothetical protein